MLPIAARAATKFSELVVCRALLAISYRLTAQNFSAKCEEVTDKDSILAIRESNLGPVIEISKVGGLHHFYERQAA